jgi:GTPase
VHENLEFYSVLRTIRAIENADVNILIIDAQSGMEAQDMNIFKLIEKNGKGVVVVVNKWDLVEKNTNTAKEYEQLIRRKLSPFDDVPIIFTSVLNKQRIHKVLEEAMTVHENRKRKITTSKLNNIMLEAIEQHNPPAHRGHYIKIKYVTQLPTHTPSFAFFCNHPKYVKDAYKRYLENKLRETFNFTGVPIRIFMRDK